MIYSHVFALLIINPRWFPNQEKVCRYQRDHQSKKDKQYNGQRKRTKGLTTIYKALHSKLKIE
jgi:hypothetical protein